MSSLRHDLRAYSIGDRALKVSHNDFGQAYEVLELFGDYELIIDLGLHGDKTLKAKVAQADRFNRGGLAVLQNALKNRGVTLTGKLADILQSCIADQELFDAKQKDFDRIHKRPNGKVQVQITVDDVRYSKTFDDLADAQRYRDRMILLGLTIEAENRELMPPDN
jgi:hypothetical protein